MSEFFSAVAEYPFLRYALAAGVLAGVTCGVVGTYVVSRRIVFVCGGIAHCVLGGMGVANYLSSVHGVPVTPMQGALVSAILAALVIGAVSIRAQRQEDIIIGALWAVGMAVGVLFISQTPGYNSDLMSYLFGNILMVRRSSMPVIGGLSFVVIATATLLYKRFQAVCFDSEFAWLRGLHVHAYYMLLLCLTALTVVVLVQVVGLILVIALLSLPAAIAGQYARSLWQMMIAAALLGAAFTTVGLAASYGPDLPAGACIIVIAGLAYLLSTVLRWAWFRLRHRPRPA